MITHLLLAAASPIVHVNAALNSLAAVLLVLGYVLIKQRKEVAHKRVMLLAFAVSSAFLVCYLYYHYQVQHVKFTAEGVVRYVYYGILLSHVLLAVTVPFLALATIYYGHRALGCNQPASDDGPSPESLEASRRYRTKHRRLARITFPIWLYVSVTGVVVYVMLYHLWPPEGL